MTDLAFDERPRRPIVRSDCRAAGRQRRRLQMVHSQPKEPDRPGLNRSATTETEDARAVFASYDESGEFTAASSCTSALDCRSVKLKLNHNSTISGNAYWETRA